MCGQPIPRDEEEVVVGGFPLHASCATERAAALSDERGDEAGSIGEAPVADRGTATG